MIGIGIGVKQQKVGGYGLAVPVATAATGVGVTSFTANWNAYSGAVVYLLDVSESSDFSTFVYENQEVNAPATSYVVIGLEPNTTYYYRVRASTEALTDPDYQAILDYATAQDYTLPSASQQALQNQLLIDLKDAGIWSKLDTFAVFATDGDSDFALIDWKRLSDYIAVNSPTFSSNGGFTGDGSTSYIDTNFNPSTSGVNYTLNDAGRFYWVDNRSSGNWEDNGAGRAISGNNNSTLIRINSATTSMNSAVDLRSDGFKSLNRTTSTNLEIFNNTTQFSRTSTSVEIPTGNQWALRAVTGFNASRFRVYGMGASLVSENTDFYNALNTYLTSL